ncbi:tRNA nucleotidyltransferase/poly(A) polymerase family protein [Arcobacter porcinus]|uniref:Multifunctional tRNA nucleotidyl transferase / 2'3'-cyclic phosphodiesterase / 2'nucleotidase / phosphatase n=1 Tax=Arcobacter porcinus TaxID=1935204 RepID=A0A5C2HFV7_9BACT|nr:CCA tRNA nucleotidyltransferase [Arcobacter porcinus]OCL83508.1 Multifunctional CCA protein [Arcobacter porcinus]OCL83727.1 Multifunctional CCA protein [Arcobacter porcinus]OCL94346.1 Multifunctional CCA protein [Aliarcobacter thereius]QEP41305.1 multifunctional tRNA nucleotidyl transferase / 2'3'-cyclic phosphodiesterase / 2'nucleotidase / phosphatase [Arcobacter porcinus]
MFTKITKLKIPKILENIFNDLKNIQAEPIIVGGSVRDNFLNKEIKDYDIEVFNIESIETLIKILSKYQKPKFVGKSFGVLKLKFDDLEFDFSLPRTESKIGQKHRDFDVVLDSKLTYEEASKRRDFTINSIGYDYFKNQFLDPYNGINDLKNRKIKHINYKTFVEDSLRVFRAVQFASRFDFKVDKNTKRLCKDIIKNRELEYLSKERVFEELKKLFLKSKKPSIGLKLLDELEIFNISFKKSYKSIDRLMKILENKDIKDEKRVLAIVFALLLKKQNREKKDIFITKVINDKNLIKHINLLIENDIKDDIKYLKRLSLKLNIEELIFIDFAKNKNKKILRNILRKLKRNNILNRPLEILVFGKDLIDAGFLAGMEFKEILEKALALQIDKKLTKKEILNRLKNYDN